MAEIIEGHYSGKDLRFGIVVSRFNEFVTKPMLEGALNELRRSGASDAGLQVVWVPGAYEIPLACQALCRSKEIDALIAIGCIIRGETDHYEHLAKSVCEGLQQVALREHIPVGFGVITVENLAQAMDRAGGKHGNKGRDAARGALEMVHTLGQLKKETLDQNRFRELIAQEFKK